MVLAMKDGMISYGFRHVILLSIMGIIAMLPIIGGICALIRKHWRLAFIGSIASLIFWLLGIPALVLIVISKDEFRQLKQSMD